MCPETDTVNESGGRYLRIYTDSTFDEFSYKMLRSIKSDEFIKPELISLGTKAVLSYNVTGCSSLSELAAERGAFLPGAADIIIRLESASKILNNFLLSEENIIIDKSRIFVDSLDKKIKFCAYPGEISEEEYGRELRELIFDMLMNTEPGDIREVTLCLRLMKKARKEKIMLHELITELILFRNENKNMSCGRCDIAGTGMYIKGKTKYSDNDKAPYSHVNDSDETVFESRIKEYDSAADNSDKVDSDFYGLYGDGNNRRYSYGDERNNETDLFDTEKDDELSTYGGKSKGSDGYKSPYNIDDLNDVSYEDEINIPNIDKKNASGSIKPKIIITQLIMLAGLAAVFLLKGSAAVIGTLPIYAVLSVCTALYIIIGHIAEKKRADPKG